MGTLGAKKLDMKRRRRNKDMDVGNTFRRTYGQCKMSLSRPRIVRPSVPEVFPEVSVET